MDHRSSIILRYRLGIIARMMQLRVPGAIGIILGLITADALAQQQPVPHPSIGAGRRLALDVCSACHIVADDQIKKPGMQPPAPSFRSIADRPNINAQSLRTFLLKTHVTFNTPPNMPSMLLSEKEATVVSEYILSLKNGE